MARTTVYVALARDVDTHGRWYSTAKVVPLPDEGVHGFGLDPLTVAVFEVDTRRAAAVATVLSWLFYDRPAAMQVNIVYERRER